VKYVLILAALSGAATVLATAQDDVNDTLIREGISRRLEADLRVVRDKVADARLRRPARREAAAMLDELTVDIEASSLDVPADFRAVLPLNPVHKRIFQVQAHLWRNSGYPELNVWQADVWGHLSLWDDPDRGSKPAVRVHMMQNEYRAGAFNFTNAGQEPVEVSLRITGMPGGVNPPYITVHEVAWTDTRNGHPVAAALPVTRREGEAYVVTAHAGLTRQVWLTFHPTELPPGIHQGRIEGTAADHTFEVPLVLNLFPIRFPDVPRLHFGGWDYTSGPGRYGVTNANREDFLAHLREHFVDSPWATRNVVPFGKCDDQGVMTTPPDTRNFDRWLDRWPEARRFNTFPAVSGKFNQHKMGTPAFDTAVQGWVRFWADYLEKHGLRPDQMAWLLVDEPRARNQEAVIIAWAKAIRSADTGIQIWEDPIYADMSNAHPEFGPACDILCPNRNMFLNAPEKYARYFIEQRDAGVTLEFYSCRGPARLLDPYAYHRMQAWSCWQHGAIASSFWALGDNAGVSSWNEYIAPRTAYTPLFLSPEAVTAGKHMEACREGIEDYEYLAMLQERVEAAERSGTSSKALKQARQLLSQLPDRVLNTETLAGFWWRTPLDRTVADAARLDILEALVALPPAVADEP